MDKPINKKILIIVATIVIIIAVSCLTVFVLKNITSKKSSTASKTDTKTLSADEVIKAFKITSLSDKSYSKQDKAAALLQYKSDKEDFGVSLPLNTSIIYSTSDADNNDDTSEVQSQLTSFMKDNGLNPDNTTIYNNNKTLSYKTYSNSTTVCQMLSNNDPATSNQSHFHQFTCITKISIADQYNSVKKLLSVEGTLKIPDDYMLAFIVNNSKNNIKYSILNLDSKTKHQGLLFAAIDDKWEYLGDLMGGGKQYATEKYSITPELQAKINDAKYKGFLKESLVKG